MLAPANPETMLVTRNGGAKVLWFSALTAASSFFSRISR